MSDTLILDTTDWILTSSRSLTKTEIAPALNSVITGVLTTERVLQIAHTSHEAASTLI